MKNRRASVLVASTAAAMLIGPLGLVTGSAGAAPRDGIAAQGESPAATTSNARAIARNFVRIQPIQSTGGARSVGLEGREVVVTTDGTNSTITLKNAAPFVRIRPFKGSPYLASAAELPKRFASLLGPEPTAVLVYGSGSGQRQLGLRQQVSAPVFDVRTGSITVRVPAKLPAITAPRAVLRFLTTPSDRPIARPVKATGSPLQGRNGCASETQAGWSMSQTCPDGPFTVSVLGSLDPNQPPPMLTATQQTYAPLSCVTYPTSGAVSSGGALSGASTLDTEQTSTDVSQSLHAGTSISTSYGGLKTGLTASYSSSSSQDANSVYAVAKVTVSGLTSTLAPKVDASITGRSITTTLNALQVLAQCGDAIGTSYTSGAAYTAVLRMQTYDASSAESLNAKISGSYGPTNASASFGGAVTSDKSVTNVSVSEACIGVSTCAQFPGYVPTPARQAGESNDAYVSDVMNAFLATFGSVQQGLGQFCATQTASCAIAVTYSPIEDAIPGSTAKSLVSSAATGTYWMLYNAQAWANAYQSLSTAYTEAAQYQQSLQSGSVYTMSTTQLQALAQQYSTTATNINRWIGSCGGTHLADSACAPILEACISAYPGQGTSATACTPQAVASIGGTTLVDPSTLDGPQLSTPATTCNESSVYANAVGATGSGTYDVQLYLNGQMSLPYTAKCVWTVTAGYQSVSAYLPLAAGTSQANGASSVYRYAPFDPGTGTMYLDVFSSGNAAIDPTCPAAGCLPIGMAENSGGGVGSSSTFDVTLPGSLLFASTTTLSGDGTGTVKQPSTVGSASPEWSVTQAQAGTSYLADSAYRQAGLVRVTGPGANAGVPPQLPPAPVGCTLSDWSGSSAPPTFAYDSTGNCLITVTGGMKVGGGNTHYITYYAKNGNGQYYYPAAICGGRSNGGGEETVDSYGGPGSTNQQLKIRYHNTYDSTVTLSTTLTYRSAVPSPAFPTGGYVPFCGSTTPLKGK